MHIRRVSIKTVKIVLIKFLPNLIIFGTKTAKTIELCKMHFLLHLIYVNVLPCETHVL